MLKLYASDCYAGVFAIASATTLYFLAPSPAYYEQDVGFRPSNGLKNGFGNSSTEHWNFQGSINVDGCVKNTDSLVYIVPGSSVDEYYQYYRYRKIVSIGSVTMGYLSSSPCETFFSKNPNMAPIYCMRVDSVDYFGNSYLKVTGVTGSFYSRLTSSATVDEHFADVAAQVSEMEAVEMIRNITLRSNTTDPLKSVCELATQVKSAMTRVVTQKDISVPYPGVEDLGDVCHDAIQGIRPVNTNMISLIAETVTMKTGIKSLASAVAAFAKTPTSKGWANAYLNWKYGVRLTILELSELATSIKKTARGYSYSSGHQRARARLTTKLGPHDSELVYTVRYSPHDDIVLKTIHRLANYSLIPELTTAWDLTPFSFIVNWVVDIENSLDVIDSIYYNCTIVPSEVVWSTSTVIDNEYLQPLSEVVDTSGVTLKHYRRVVGTQLHPKAIFSSQVTIGDHIAETSAIIIQRMK